MVGDHQNFSGSRDLTTPLQGSFVIRGLGLATLNQFTKFEVSNSTCYEDMKDVTKYLKWDGVKGHPRSMKKAPFDRVHVSFHQRSIVTISCTVSEIQRDIGKKIAASNLPQPLFGAPVGGDLFGISPRFLASENQSPLATVRHGLRYLRLCRLSRTPTCGKQTNGRTDRQTDTRLRQVPRYHSVAWLKITVSLGVVLRSPFVWLQLHPLLPRSGRLCSKVRVHGHRRKTIARVIGASRMKDFWLNITSHLKYVSTLPCNNYYVTFLSSSVQCPGILRYGVLSLFCDRSVHCW